MQCPKFGFEITDNLKKSYCLNCPDRDQCFTKPRFEMGKVDIFKLARLLKEKEEREKNESGL